MLKEQTLLAAQRYIKGSHKKGEAVDITFQGENPRTALIYLKCGSSILTAGCFAEALEHVFNKENGIDPRFSVG